MKFIKEQIEKLEKIYSEIEEEDIKKIVRTAYDRWFSEEINPIMGDFGIDYGHEKIIDCNKSCCLIGTYSLGKIHNNLSIYDLCQSYVKNQDLINDWCNIQFSLMGGFDQNENWKPSIYDSKYPKYYNLAENISKVIFNE